MGKKEQKEIIVRNWKDSTRELRSYLVRGKVAEFNGLHEAMLAYWGTKDKSWQKKHPWIDLRDLVVKGSKGHRIDLRKLRLKYCNIDKCKFIHVDMRGAHLGHAIYDDIWFIDADVDDLHWGKHKTKEQIKALKKKLRGVHFKKVLHLADWVLQLMPA
jgi:hypothetical protein